MVGTAREAEQALARRLAEVGDRVRVDVGVADAAAREGRARAAQPDELAVVGEQRGVPGLGSDHGIGLRPSSPQSPSRPSSSPARPSARPGSSSAARRRRAGARASRRPCGSGRCRGCRAASRSGARSSRGRRRGRFASSRPPAVAGQARQADRDTPEGATEVLGQVVPAQPRVDGPEEAGVVHRPVPAVAREVEAEVVAVLGDEKAVGPGGLDGRARLGGDGAVRATSRKRPTMFATSTRQPSSS